MSPLQRHFSDNLSSKDFSMDRVRQFIRNWLGFSQTETNGFLILLPLVILVLASAPLYKFYRSSQPPDFSKDYAMLDSISARWNKEVSIRADTSAAVRVPHVLKPFDPNKATVAELKSLGLPEHLSKRIVSYRQKGGVFRVKRDLLKIYGVDSTYYHQLYRYIDLPVSKPVHVTRAKDKVETGSTEAEKKFNLNDADTLQLKKVKGIGKVLAARIIKFREALGGFTSADQLKEIYGLDSTVALQLRNKFYVEENFKPVTISINSADQATLERHPYISRALARSILSYRYQHGTFTDVADLKNLHTITPAQAEKLLPYLTVKD
jgi:competence protein ComEA